MSPDFHLTPGLLAERVGQVVKVTLNRPEHGNAFNDDLRIGLPDLMRDLDRDPTVRAAVLTGAGRSFCAGGNISDWERFRLDLESRRQSLRDARLLVEQMLSMKLPVVAAVNGAAVGVGCTLAALCDIVFLADTAVLADPHILAGLVAGDGNAITWPFMTSMLVAKQYLLTGDKIRAEEAQRLGLANFVVPAATVVDDAMAFAQRLAELPPQAVQDTKQALNLHLRQATVSVLSFGLSAESQSFDTTEYRGITARALERQRDG
jgi:enoyl-CoA hydratase